MTIGYILLWLVGFSVASLLFRSLRGPRQPMGWIAVATFILAALGAASVLWGLDTAGFIGAALWGLFVVFPMSAVRKMETLLRDEDFERALRIASWVATLHPADGFPSLLRLLRAYVKEPPASLEPTRWLRDEPPANGLARLVIGYAFARATRCSELRSWIETLDPSLLYSNTGLYVLYLRALGETGEIDRLSSEFWKIQSLMGSEVPDLLARAQLVVLAYFGETERTRLALEQFPQWSSALRERWLGIAQQHTGRAPLQVIPLFTRAPEPTRFEVREKATKTFATWTFMALNGIVFAAEAFLGGTTQAVVLFGLGGLLPEAVYEQGQWWRLLTANFLHYGPLHIGMNMLALFALGPSVEQALGWARYSLLYLLSGMGSMATVTALSYYGVLGDQFLVGASGAISGLIGGTGGLLLLAWRQHRAPMALQRLKGVGFAILLQTVFDLSTPQVSFTAHFAGAVWGFLLSFVLSVGRRARMV